MGSVGDAYDNAMAESFFATLECELLDRRTFRNPAEARMVVFRYLEGWYNPRRRHSALGYLSPVNFEAKHHALAAGERPLGRSEFLDSPFSPGVAGLYSAAPQRKLLTPRKEGEQEVLITAPQF